MTTTKRQSLNEAISRARSGKSGVMRCGLAGCPVGGWGETQQALRRIAEELPLRSERSYTVEQIVSALYTTDHAERYQVRE